MHYRGVGQFSCDRRGADFSRGMHWCATKELTELCSSSVTVVSYDLVISHTKFRAFRIIFSRWLCQKVGGCDELKTEQKGGLHTRFLHLN